jgi:putative MATE family efflux protein
MAAKTAQLAGVDRAIFRRLFDLAMPIVGLNVMSVLTLAVDTAMCGRLVNAEEALTALGFATQLTFLLMVAILGLTVGTVAFVARAWGAREVERVNHVLHQSIQLTYLVSAVVAVLGNAAAGIALEWLGADETVRELGVAYLRPLFSLTVFLYLNMLFAAALRAVGNTVLPFMVALVSNVLNVVLNYGLILGKLGLPALGVRGAAWGTVISQAVAVALMVALLERDRVPGVRARLGLVRVDRPLANDLFRIGAPAALDMVVLNVAFLSIVGMLARVAQVTVAAHGIGLRIQSLAFVPGLGVSQAIGAMVGNALGADDESEARQVVRAGVLLSTGIMSAIGLAIIVGAEPIIAIFDVDAHTELGRYSIVWVRVLGLGMPVVGVNIALIGMLRGAGATNTSLLINIVGTILVQVPLSWFLGFVVGWEAFGIWVALPISFVVRAALGIMAYQRGEWARAGATI